jgi:hypothetical protein
VDTEAKMMMKQQRLAGERQPNIDQGELDELIRMGGENLGATQSEKRLPAVI